jgi:non-ribosomal peptide synthetase component F
VSHDIGKFYRILQRYNVTVLHHTPWIFYQLIEEDIRCGHKLKLKNIILAGEPPNFLYLQKWMASYPTTSLVNLYGLSETAGGVAAYSIEEIAINSKTSIGKSVSDITICLLDEHLHQVFAGSIGEICIISERLSLGYWQQPDLTAEKFIANPFGNGDRLYRTGDLGRYLPDGNIEFLGRIDNQVKIRGFRIEPGEIESIINSCEGAKASVVLARED